MIKGYIIEHRGTFSSCFDLIVHKSIKFREWGYKTNCGYVSEFLKENPNYVYIGSEDLSHSIDFNSALEREIEDLKDKGFILIRKEINPSLSLPSRVRLEEELKKIFESRGKKDERRVV